MINADMRIYDFYTLGAPDAYGQQTLPEDPIPAGKIKIAINISGQSIQDNINYLDCNYIGLTMAKVEDTYVIQYGDEKLKVLYVNPRGRYKQVYLKKI